MENRKIGQNIKPVFYSKKYIVPAVLIILTLVFCQKTFSDSISVTSNSLFIDVQGSGTATVKILNDQKNPLSNIPVAARSNNESVVTVVPGIGLTNSNGQISFKIAGISNGTATITFNTNTLSKSLPVSVVSNIAPCAIADSSGGGVDEFAPEMMNDGVEKDNCSYHWIRTRKEVGQKKTGWIRLDWDEDVTVTRMIVQTTDCNESCGEDPDDALYIDSGRNVGNGIVQYLDEDEITWITDGEFIEEIGDVEYSFTKPITTKAIRIKKIAPSTQCNGQQSNPVVFEWKVYGTPSCN
ncbi:MAG: Ig-like domain-containing protein [Planctomycetes bacterium]|nr:Ig-like domain-containing protein [Planctomycetota bacterium]